MIPTINELLGCLCEVEKFDVVHHNEYNAEPTA